MQSTNTILIKNESCFQLQIIRSSANCEPDIPRNSPASGSKPSDAPIRSGGTAAQNALARHQYTGEYDEDADPLHDAQRFAE